MKKLGKIVTWLRGFLTAIFLVLAICPWAYLVSMTKGLTTREVENALADARWKKEQRNIRKTSYRNYKKDDD